MGMYLTILTVLCIWFTIWCILVGNEELLIIPLMVVLIAGIMPSLVHTHKTEVSIISPFEYKVVEIDEYHSCIIVGEDLHPIKTTASLRAIKSNNYYVEKHIHKNIWNCKSTSTNTYYLRPKKK